MATHSVAVIIKARDEASKKFGAISHAAGGMSSTLKKAAVAAGAYFGARAIKSFLAETLELYGRQEKAVKGLADALELLGRGGPDIMADMQQFARSIQQTTVYGDELVLELMKMGATMAGLSGKELQDATRAAIGLATAYKIDVVAAMRLVSRARVGDTTTLARYGIKLEEGLSAQQKFNRILEIGAKNFRLAEAETNTYAGAVAQAKNAIGDLKEVIGQALAPVIQDFAEWIKTLNVDSLKAALNVAKWTASISAVILITPKVVAAVKSVVLAFKALATGQAVVHGLAGPAGWAALAAGAAFAASAVCAINNQFDKFISNLNDNIETAENGIDGVDQAMGRLNLTIGQGSVKVDDYKKAMDRLRQRYEGPDIGEQIRRDIGALKQAVRDFGKTEDELLIKRMREQGYQEPSIDMVKRYARQKKWLEEQKSLNEAITDTVRDLKREIATFGRDENEIKLFDLFALGASEFQITQIRDLMAKLEGLKKGEKKKYDYDSHHTLSVNEARLLTMAPGGRYNYEQQIAKSTDNTHKNTNQLVKISKDTLNVMERIYAVGGINLSPANFG